MKTMHYFTADGRVTARADLAATFVEREIDPDKTDELGNPKLISEKWGVVRKLDRYETPTSYRGN